MAELEVGRNDPPAFKLFGAVILADQAKPSRSPEPEDTGVKAGEENSAAAAAVAEAAEVARGAAALPCPRCKSRETKFCYFNNYNVNQPRHFCRACHRYWTAGGTLRNVPVGAGRRRGRPAASLRSGATAVAAACLIEYGTDERTAIAPATAASERWVMPPPPSAATAGRRLSG